MTYLKGGPGPWLGKKRGKTTDKIKKKISISLTGFKRTDENKQRIADAKIGEKNPMWKGGRMKVPSGHVLLLMRNHPFSNCNGRVFEHRIVMENKIGRYLLKHEIIHHIDSDPSNNSIENLYLTDKSGNSKAHGSLNLLIKDLLRKKIIIFNFEKGIYE